MSSSVRLKHTGKHFASAAAGSKTAVLVERKIKAITDEQNPLWLTAADSNVYQCGSGRHAN